MEGPRLRTTANDVAVWERLTRQRILATLDELGEASTKTLARHPNLIGLVDPKRLRQMLYAMFLFGVLEKPQRGGPGAGNGHGLVWRRKQ